MKTDPLISLQPRRRRALLRVLFGVCGVVALGLPGLRPAGATGNHFAAWLRGEGARSLGDLAALARLGAAYLEAQPQEADLDRLAQLLLGERRGTIRERLIEAIARDWRDHDVAVLEGWVCSRTEARVCAAVHLLDRARA